MNGDGDVCVSADLQTSERRGRDADDGERLPLDTQREADRGRLQSELLVPEPVADDGDRRCPGVIIIGG